MIDFWKISEEEWENRLLEIPKYPNIILIKDHQLFTVAASRFTDKVIYKCVIAHTEWDLYRLTKRNIKKNKDGFFIYIEDEKEKKWLTEKLFASLTMEKIL